MGTNLAKICVGNIVGTIHDAYSTASKYSRFGSVDIFDMPIQWHLSNSLHRFRMRLVFVFV